MRWLLPLYVGLLLAVWAFVFFGGDRWWPATILLFSPLWILGLPLPLFLIGLFRRRAGWRRWLLWGVGGAVVLFPLMGLCLPWRSLLDRDERHLTVLTCNLGGGVDRAALSTLIREEEPDIACFQESPPDIASLFPRTWSVVQEGELVVASRFPCETVQVVKREHPATRWPRPICHVVRVGRVEANFYVATLHVESPRYGLAAVTDATTLIAPSRRATLVEQTENRRLESRQLSVELATITAPLVIAGDFNMPTCSTIYRASWSAYQNAFSIAGLGLGHTATVTEGGIDFSSRIDHVLCSGFWKPTNAWVGPDIGSDHDPLIATFKVR